MTTSTTPQLDTAARPENSTTSGDANKGPPSSLVQFRTVVLRQCVHDTRPDPDLLGDDEVGISAPAGRTLSSKAAVAKGP